MNEIAVADTRALVVSERQAELMRAGVSQNTLKAYRHALAKLQAG